MDATLRVTKSYSVDELSNLSSVPIALLQGYTLRAVCKAVCEAVAVDAGQLVLGTGNHTHILLLWGSLLRWPQIPVFAVEVTSLQRLGTPLSPTRLVVIGLVLLRLTFSYSSRARSCVCVL